MAKGIAELRINGYTSVGRLLDAAGVGQLRGLIDAAIGGQRPDLDVRWSDSVKYWRIENPLRLDPSLLRLAAHPAVIALVERYFARRPYLSDIDLRRIPPTDMSEVQSSGYSSSNWHRDTRGRQVKLMIYLSDVAEADSNFSLVPGTHIGAHYRKKEYEESRLSDAEVEAMKVSTVEWRGQAGDAMVFDTNLIHRLRRKPMARVRDSITYYYTPGQALTTIDVDRRELEHLPESMRAVFGNPPLPFKRSSHT
ncbi:MAG: phytanoyl-CoA dioxygenase family protein [Gammaproteobacteria bacterium]|nr:phytanoyl-CoA dioxygenase family protein [Gammaproteobacteria bacterium]